MLNETRRLVEGFLSQRSINPDPVSVSTRFQQYMVSHGVRSLDEREAVQAARAVGIPEDAIPNFLDEFASWI